MAPVTLTAPGLGTVERWAIQKGYPVLPKSTRPERMRQNADLFSFQLDEGVMAALETMDRGDGLAWNSGDPTKAA
jgi:2,5-diketo-D-gluconate reductase A